MASSRSETRSILLRAWTAALVKGGLEVAQPIGRETEGFHVRAGLPEGPQRLHVDRLPGPGLRLLVVVLGVGGRGRVQLLGHCRLLVRDDVVRPAPHSGGGGAQLLPDHRAGQDSALVLERDAGDLPLPRVLDPLDLVRRGHLQHPEHPQHIAPQVVRGPRRIRQPPACHQLHPFATRDQLHQSAASRTCLVGEGAGPPGTR
ncbi:MULTISPECIES: hypothetical protein [unclassified Streptomyces]|uniref:hypothetical protein n=1 Tax=unclassified Streptomyces TaxID=2593676 RepID=UPI0004BE18A9|nr:MULTISPECIES: hypothetical protein [unclassified Streptomyces]